MICARRQVLGEKHGAWDAASAPAEVKPREGATRARRLGPAEA